MARVRVVESETGAVAFYAELEAKKVALIARSPNDTTRARVAIGEVVQQAKMKAGGVTDLAEAHPALGETKQCTLRDRASAARGHPTQESAFCSRTGSVRVVE